MSLANNSLSERILDILDSTFCFYALRLTDLLGWSNMANHYLRPTLLKACGFSIGSHCQIRPGMVIHSHKHRVTIGDYSAINKQVLFDAPEPIIIGKYCDIGCNVAFVTGNHILDTDFTGKRPMKPSAPIVLEDYVWVGAQVTILEGVTIGRGSVVAAGSVVTKSVPPNTLVGGVPAKVLKPINQPVKELAHVE